MSVFLLILVGVFALNLAWAIGSVRLARHVPGRVGWIVLNLGFVTAQLVGLATLGFGRARGMSWDRALPKFALSAVLLWNLLGLGLLLLAGMAALVLRLGRFGRRRRGGAAPPPPPEPGHVSRGQFIKMTALAAPSAFTVLVSAISQAQLRHFRVRPFVLPVAGLPRDLDGMTIAHVSDMHLGELTTAPVLRAMVKTVNDLKADLVLLTGDLINHDLADLSEGLVLASAMQGRYGHCMIEGNHDLFESRAVFEASAHRSSVPFLVNQSLTARVRGCPVQLLGLRWDPSGMADRDQVIGGATRALLAQRDPGAFPILLAHHPHAFDAAAAMGIPLTLSGHTHGGQLMLGEDLGVGPMLYRYWSGHYLRANSQLIVSNGVGNWFPLRVDAPAEIVHLTLRRA